MKKKIALLLVLVLILTSVFTGCSMVQLNEGRDNALVVASIKYDGGHTKGLTATVTKKELKDYYATQGYILVAYYGMSEQEAYDYCAESLAQQKLSKLKALDELCFAYNQVNTTKLDPKTIKVVNHTALKTFTDGKFADSDYPTIFDNLLYTDEKIAIMKDFNKQIKELFDNYIKEIEAEQALEEEENKEETPEEEEKEEEEVKDKPAIRATRPKQEEKVDEVKADDKYEASELESKKNELKAIKRIDQEWSEKENNNELSENEKEALARLRKQLNKIGKSFDMLFEDLVNAKLQSHYRLVVVSSADNATVDSLFADKMSEGYKANVDNFVVKQTDGSKVFLEDKYKSAVSGGSPVFYHPIVGDIEHTKDASGKAIASTGYGYTLNILLNFDKTDAELLKQYNDYNKDGVFSDSEKAVYNEKAKQYAKNILVNISNPEYDPQAKCTADKENQDKKDEYGYHDCGNADCKLRPFGLNIGEKYDSIFTEYEKTNVKPNIVKGYKVPVITVLKMINFDLFNVEKEYNEKITAETNSDKKFELELQKQVALRETFVKWTYLVNDDPGMFSQDNAKGYLVAKTGKSDFVESYTKQSRELMGGNYATADTKEPTYASPVYNGTDHFVGNYSTAVIDPIATKDIDPQTVASMDGFGAFDSMIAISEFGIHIIMIADMPGYYQQNIEGFDNIIMDSAVVTYGRDDLVSLQQSIKEGIKGVVENELYEKEVKPLVDGFDNFVSIDKNSYKSLYEKK